MPITRSDVQRDVNFGSALKWLSAHPTTRNHHLVVNSQRVGLRAPATRWLPNTVPSDFIFSVFCFCVRVEDDLNTVCTYACSPLLLVVALFAWPAFFAVCCRFFLFSVCQVVGPIISLQAKLPSVFYVRRERDKILYQTSSRATATLAQSVFCHRSTPNDSLRSQRM